MSLLSKVNFLELSFILWAFILPWSLAGIQIGLLISVVLTVLITMRNKDRIVILHPVTYSIMVYLVLRFLSAIVSPTPERSFLAVFHTDWPLLAIPVLGSAPLTGQGRSRMVRGLILSAALVSVYAVYQFFSGTDLWRGRTLAAMEGFYRATGAYDFYLTLAGNQLMIFFLALPLAFSARKTGSAKSRHWIGLAVVLILASIVGTFGRSAWIAMIVIGLLALFWKLKGRRILDLIVIGVISLAAFFVAPIELRDRLASTFEFSRNQDRVNLWKTSWLMIRDKPLFGIGPGNFKDQFDHYRVPGVYDATGHAHNDYLNLAATSGIPTLAAWLCIWLVWFHFALRTVKSSSLSGSDRHLLIGCLLGIASIMVSAVFQCYYTDLENNICWSLLTIIGLQIILGGKRTDSEPAI